MKRFKTLSAVSVFILSLSSSAHAITIWYQPTPYPTKAVIDYSRDVKKSIKDASVSIPHITDGWLSNSYNQTFVANDDGRLQVGGWGDQYRSYLKFSLDGLPKNVVTATLWLFSYPRGDNSTPTPLAMCKAGSAWDTNVTWSAQPSFSPCWGWYTAPTSNQWWGPYITTWYNEWQNNPATNNGIMLFPQYNDNRFNVFRSSDYANDGARPMLALSFTPTLELKMPFDGLDWRVTTEIGGGGCDYIHGGHQGPGYFSIDFSGKALNPDGTVKYPDPASANIPILAAGGGIVKSIVYNSSTAGNFVEIMHGTTGITSRYLHMKSISPTIYQGQNIPQGKFLGYMGDTAAPGSVHLDFNIQHNGSGDKDQVPLARVVMEGQLMKQYQVDGCTNGNSNRYYWSSNVMIP
ncbi:MAG: DNRLRE domain-containing protein [Patescibacteria group bacterium]